VEGRYSWCGRAGGDPLPLSDGCYVRGGAGGGAL